MSFSETILLFLLALIFFGPKKLPEIARLVGKYMNEFRRASNEFKAQLEQEVAHLEAQGKQTILPPSHTPEGTTSRSLNVATSTVESTSGDPAANASTPTEAPANGGVASTNPSSPPAPSESVSVAPAPASSQESHA